jgi:hypothetical protein
MPRTALVALCSLALAAVASAPAASAQTTYKKCSARSYQVVGDEIVAKVQASNVDPSQAGFATCPHAARVMKRVAWLGLEKPRGDVSGFFCRPTVSSRNDDRVSYICTFRGADTATFIKLTFTVVYKDD